MLIYAMVTLGSLTLWEGCPSFAVPISNETKSELHNSTSDDVNKMAVIPEPKVQTNITRKEEQLSGRVLYYTKTITEPRIPLTLSEEQLGILAHVNKSKLLLTNSTIIISQFSKIQQNQHITQSTTYKEQFRLQDAKGHEQTSYTGTNSSKSQHLEGRYNETQFKSTNQSNITEAKANVQNKYEKSRVYSIYDLVSGNHDIIEKKESSFLGHTENKNSKTMGNLKENENTTNFPAKEGKLSANPRGTAAYQHKAKKTDAHVDYKTITVLYNLYSLVVYVANQENEQVSLKTNMNQHNGSIVENKNFKKFSALRVLYSLVSYVANQKYEETEKTNSLNEDKNHTNSEGGKVHDVGIIEKQKDGKRVKKRQNVEGGDPASFVSYTSSDQFDNTNNPNLDRLESVKTEEPSLIQEVKGYLKSYGWRGYLIIAVSVVIGLTAILFLVGFIAKICRWHKNHKQLTKLQHLIHPASI